MNYSAQKIFILAAGISIVVLLAMFIVPVLSAVVLVFLGVIGLLMVSKWVANLFNGGETPQQQAVSNEDMPRSPWAKLPRKLARMAEEEITEGEIVSEKKKE